MTRRAAVALLVAALLPIAPHAREPMRVAIVDAGATAREIRETLAGALRGPATVLDAGLVDAALAGAGYAGSTNLTLEEARRLGRVAGADALALVVARDFERPSDNESTRWECAVGLFLVDSRSGALLRYRGVAGVGEDRATARRAACAAAQAEAAAWVDVVDAAERRRLEGPGPAGDPAAVDFVTNPEGGADLVPPRFCQRPAPRFTDEADRMRVVATVDLIVQFNADGTYGPIDVVRWAGFGLDEASIEAVRARKFWPARRSGAPVAARALLRYNFRFRDL